MAEQEPLPDNDARRFMSLEDQRAVNDWTNAMALERDRQAFETRRAQGGRRREVALALVAVVSALASVASAIAAFAALRGH